jgi:alkylation response protein AidB-like acyl-CoA dehydrogenase
MPVYQAPLDDFRFILHDVLNLEALTTLAGFEDATPDLVDAVLEEGARFVEQELLPLNQSGDLEGCHFDQGVVTTPAGFKDAYRKFREGGWTSLATDPAWGGQGLPHALATVLQEMICSANLSFGLYPGLSHGAYDALLNHADADMQKIYLPKLVDGSWSGTMCLTEPHCGTDLGLMRTRAEPVGDGRFLVTGTKIFISAGEHDLTENILHLVLARLPDAPAGIKGISLFLVPKFLPDTADPTRVGARNQVVCGSIEHKMGIKASSTCVMNFEGATGWLIGPPHKGMRAMFTMMNNARLAVGIQGLGIAEIALQNAVDYAGQRRQGRALRGAAEPDQAADPILVHPDVRRMILNIRAINEPMRALALWVAMNVDLHHRHPDARTRQEADDLVALMTPIIKSFATDHGFEAANLAIQIYGGHGYIRDYGIEQFARDARIAMIYEGANGIQALDLIGRKLPRDYGRLLRSFFHPVEQLIAQNQDSPALGGLVLPLARAFAKLQQATAMIAQKSLKNPDEAAAVASDYLRFFGLVALGFMWVRMAEVAHERIGQDGINTVFYQEKLAVADYFMQKILPQTQSLFVVINAGAKPVMAPFEIS